jgi:hypothetical protein
MQQQRPFLELELVDAVQGIEDILHDFGHVFLGSSVFQG